MRHCILQSHLLDFSPLHSKSWGVCVCGPTIRTDRFCAASLSKPNNILQPSHTSTVPSTPPSSSGMQGWELHHPASKQNCLASHSGVLHRILRTRWSLGPDYEATRMGGEDDEWRTRWLSKCRDTDVWPLNDKYHFWRSSSDAGWPFPRASFTRNCGSRCCTGVDNARRCVSLNGHARTFAVTSPGVAVPSVTCMLHHW